MKILKVLLVLILCSTMWFTMGVNGCSGQIEEPDLTSTVDTTAAEMTMPLVTTVNGLESGEDLELQDLCLMNYPPDVNFIGYINLDEANDTLNRFGIDKFEDESRQIIEELVSYIEEAVVYAYDDGSWGLLLRPKGDMTEFVNGYLTDTLDSMNKAGNEDTWVARVLDESAVILSFSQEINAVVADRVDRGLVERECAFVRFMRYDATPLNGKPMINLIAKAKTSLLDEPLAQALPDMQEEIQKAMAVLNIDKQDGVFRFAIGIVDNTDVSIASVITYFSFYLDTDSYILSTMIDKLMEEVASGNIEFGGGDDGGDEGPAVGN